MIKINKITETIASQIQETIEKKGIEIAKKDNGIPTTNEDNLTDCDFGAETTNAAEGILCGSEPAVISDDSSTYKKQDFNDKIDYTEQGNMGDCWILAGVNALNFADKGKTIIQNALDYTDDTVTVHLTCGDYTYSKASLKELSETDDRYSQGDLDMVAIESAIIDSIKDIQNGLISIKSDDIFISQYELMYTIGANGGSPEYLLLMLAGKQTTISSNGIEKFEALDKLNNDRKGHDKGYIVMTAGCLDSKFVEDVNGNNVAIYGSHAYSIKSTDMSSVTIVNPHDSSKEIILPIDTFINSFDQILTADLSQNNANNQYFSVNRNTNAVEFSLFDPMKIFKKDTKDINYLIENISFEDTNQKTTIVYKNGKKSRTIIDGLNNNIKNITEWGNETKDTVTYKYKENMLLTKTVVLSPLNQAKVKHAYNYYIELWQYDYYDENMTVGTYSTFYFDNYDNIIGMKQGIAE